ncbi:MAG: hypothetical protein EBY88_00510 [Actinobacteria bacterium]|nr:hypothetical protein [Acidimicrobiia bacterium]NDI14726.1 hypothetical protein [Actinomycetota bacterium]
MLKRTLGIFNCAAAWRQSRSRPPERPPPSGTSIFRYHDDETRCNAMAATKANRTSMSSSSPATATPTKPDTMLKMSEIESAATS